ncbi:hypothetical protein MP638_001172 [Amoeboaphelidium occidentale]|nr:hypothetical protein MP638_001172 [Amoeboaphelidium occidentale]
MKVLGVLALLPFAFAFPGGAKNCVYPDKSQMSPGKSGSGGFKLKIMDSSNKPLKTVQPGGTVLIEMSAPMSYKGFLLHASQSDVFEEVVGKFEANDDEGLAQTMECVGTKDGGITQTKARNDQGATLDTFKWIAPVGLSGNVTFYGIGVVSGSEWYGDKGSISASIDISKAAAPSTGTSSSKNDSAGNDADDPYADPDDDGNYETSASSGDDDDDYDSTSDSGSGGSKKSKSSSGSEKSSSSKDSDNSTTSKDKKSAKGARSSIASTSQSRSATGRSRR